MRRSLLPACSVNVKKEQNGDDKQVDISTPVGGIHVSKGANVADVGLAVYPGARLKQEDSDGKDKSANVNISGFGFGLKVVALEYRVRRFPDETHCLLQGSTEEIRQGARVPYQPFRRESGYQRVGSWIARADMRGTRAATTSN